MRRQAVIAALLIAATGCTSLRTDVPGIAGVDGAEAQRQIVVTVVQEGTLALGLAGAPSGRYLRRRGYGTTPNVERSLQRIADEHGLRRVRGWAIRSIDVYCEVLEVPKGRDIDEIIDRLNRDGDVQIAQRMNLFETLGRSYDDPYADLQSAVAAMGISTVHSMATGRGVVIGVVDSRVDERHPDLSGRVRIHRDLVRNRPMTRTGEIHGTAIAGIIASVANNAIGIVGIAPDSEIAALRACWSVKPDFGAARCSTFSLALALENALELDLDIINMSLAGPTDPLLSQLLDEAIARGIVVVAAAETMRDTNRSFPASHPGVVAASMDDNWSDTEDSIPLPAPGLEVLSTTPNGGYGFFSGNSLAAAHVTGAIALIRERNPETSVERIVEALRQTGQYETTPHSIDICRAMAALESTLHCANLSEAIAGAAR